LKELEEAKKKSAEIDEKKKALEAE